MLSGSNRDKFGPLCKDFKNQFGFGEDRYPKSVDQCLSLLNQWGNMASAPSNSPCTPWGAQTPPHDPKPGKALVFAQGSSSKKPSAKDSEETSSKSSKSSKVLVSCQITNMQCKNAANRVILLLCALSSHNPRLPPPKSMLWRISMMLLRQVMPQV